MAAFTGLEGFAVTIIIAAALGILARKSKQPTVTAYIITGILAGPVVLSIVSTNPDTELLAELGLAFLMFLIGLEIRLEEIKDILKPTVAIASAQMILMAVVGYLAASYLGFTQIEALFIAAASSFSSTAVVVKLLSDKDEISTLPGKLDVGMLLIQDVVVVLLLAIISTGARTPTEIAVNLAEVGGMILVIGLVSYGSSRYFLPRLFEEISSNRHAFFVHGLAWALLLVSVADHLGLSMEIGAFFAGLSLAQLPYSHELQERVRPLTDFFMAVFFIDIGLGLTGSAFAFYWKEALIASGIFIAAKLALHFMLIDRAKFTPETSMKASLNMSQISEFSLILGALGVANGYLEPGVLGFLSMVAVVTMGISSYFITYNAQIFEYLKPWLEKLESEEKQDVDFHPMENHAVVIGYDQMAKRVLSALEEYYDDIIVVDKDPANVEELGASNYEYIYGDFKHGEIRRASNVKKANFVLCISSDHAINMKVLEDADRYATVFARAETMERSAELYEMGAYYVTQKNVLTGDKMSEYIKLYLEDRDLFLEEVEQDIERIDWGGKQWRK